MTTMKTPLAEARGTGSAHEGAGTWWHERTSAVALLLLAVWLAVSLWRLPDLSYLTLIEWLANPLAATPLILLVLAFFWHLAMGLKVVIEDYQQREGAKLFWIMCVNFAAIFGAALGVFSILKAGITGALL